VSSPCRSFRLLPGAAIVKYRLYDIDVVINKSLVLGIMAGVITAGYQEVITTVSALADFIEAFDWAGGVNDSRVG
jgi:hypothetical protein